MTTVTFFRKGESFLGFRASGHSGQAPSGEDIVCSAVSTAVGFAECEITDVLKLDAEVVIDDKKAEVSVVFPDICEASQPVFSTLFIYLSRLSEEYPKYLKIVEV